MSKEIMVNNEGNAVAKKEVPATGFDTEIYFPSPSVVQEFPGQMDEFKLQEHHRLRIRMFCRRR
jgi:hypothetical protein